MPTMKKGISGQKSRRRKRPFFHQRINNIAAGNEAVTVLLKSAHKKKISAKT